MRLFILSLGILLFYCHLPAFAQTSEYVSNPSFEDKPRQNHPPTGWWDCSFEDESPVDVHPQTLTKPDSTGFFGVTTKAFDGSTYLGMVTRDNGTYEGVTAKLLQPLLAGRTYKISMVVNQSATYKSISRNTYKPVNYDSPTRLEIWGGDGFCDMITLFDQYDVFEAGIWTEIVFYVTPERDFKFLGLYARHPSEENTNGNILLDDLQLVKVDPETLEEY